MSAAEKIDRLESVFLGTAKAVCDAQRRLDDAVPLRGEHGPSAFPASYYALPRASVALSFGVRIEKRRRIFFVHRKANELLVHRLHFDVVATPQPPAPPPSSYRRVLLQPSFLLTAEEEAKRHAQLAAALQDRGQNVPDAKAMIFFRLPRQRVLAVRVGRRQRGDTLYLYEPEEAEPWTSYRAAGDGKKAIHYRPLSLLAQSLRRWQETGQALQGPDSATFRGGFENLQAFHAALEDGLEEALAELSRPDGTFLRHTADAGLEPTFYDFAGIEALVSFSTGEADVDFTRISSEADPERDDVPASVVRIRLEPSIESPRVTTELLELEYLLVGEDRRSAIELIVEQAKPKGDLNLYRELIEDPARQQDALLLRAFLKKKERLLVIWPADDDEDLVFGCVRDWHRREGYEIKNIKVAKKPAEPVHRVTLVADEGADDEEVRYRPFHRFFRAVLAWKRRGEGDG